MSHSDSSPAQSSGKHWIDYVTLIMVVCNTLVTLFGGWYFLFRYEAAYFRASEGLAEVQKDMQLLKLKVADAKQRLEMRQSKLAVTENSLKMLDSLRPKTSLITVPKVEWDKHNVVMHFIIENKGQYLVRAKCTYFVVTTRPFEGIYQVRKNDPIPRDYQIPKDSILYATRSRKNVTDIPAGTSQERLFTFKINNPHIKSFYYLVRPGEA